uniref:uncharacterized protein LOC100176666 n=1 Tax=Ciona intestinalis TaxID=7719 RepID=UPI000180CDE6|nr:uncharacterized protein LOC100176666 [Ciona intestinalis]|eukprot:XP_002131215.1 uncharacterized protein LOC100176666 [Ciona intestinalis]
MKFFQIIALFLLISVLADASKQAKLFKKAKRGLDRRTVEFLKRNKCTVRGGESREDIGVARWSQIIFSCHNLEQDLPSVICDKKCVNPVTCRKIRGARNVPVPIVSTVQTRDGSWEEVTLHAACTCVARGRVTSRCNSRNK